LLGLTLVPPAVLLASGHALLAVLLLAVLHVPLVVATLFPHSTWFGPVLTRLPGAPRHVWLTIDDGPSTDTRDVLDLLDAFDARATFFLVGERALRHPDLVAAIRERGHDIGNHSMTHPAAGFWCLPPGRMLREIGNAQDALTSLSGSRPRWFRSVVGHTNPFVEPVLAGLGLRRVSWSTRGYDAVSRDPALVAERIARDLAPGAIVLLHEGAAHGQSVPIIRRVLEAVRDRGLRAEIPEAGARPPASC